MLEFDDPWWLGAVLVLMGCWVLGLIVPVQLASAQFQVTGRYAEYDDDTVQEEPPRPTPPGLGLPILGLAAGATVVAVSLRKRIVEPESGNRWLWMLAAAGASTFWMFVLMVLILRLAARLG